MSEKKIDPFSTSVHMDLMSGHDEKELKVFAALDYLRYCPSQAHRRDEIIASYGITEADVEKYKPEWDKLNSK